MKDRSKNKHEFALYYDILAAQLPSKVPGQLLLTDSEIIHRITHVLRLQKGDQFILFDRHSNALVELHAQAKKELSLHVIAIKPNKTLTSAIIFFLPLLKREALNAALYSLTEVGINTIQLVATEKTERSLTAHELERAQRTIIAAAEQSKNFNFPELLAPVGFAQCVQVLHNKSGLKIFFDPEGIPLIDQILKVRDKKADAISLMIGPEGDLTSAEKNSYKKLMYHFAR